MIAPQESKITAAIRAIHWEGEAPNTRDLATTENRHVLEVLEQVGQSKAQVARVLGIHRRKLYRLIER